MPPAAPPETTPDEAPELGLLLIHGIGAHEKGATLVSWLDALNNWMDDWLSGAARVAAASGVSKQELSALGRSPEAQHLLDEARVPPEARYRRENALADGVLRYVTGSAAIASAALSSSDTQAHARIRLRAVDTRGGLATSTIEVVEAHWQDSFPKPTWSETAYWLLRIAPLIFLLQFGQQVRERWTLLRETRSGWALALLTGSVMQLVIVVAILPVIQLVFVVFATFGWVPIPGYGSVIAWLQEVVAGVLGDAYIFAASPARLAAVVSEARQALASLAGCKRVVVVAHSQGAAVAYSALEDGCPPNLAGLLTLGSGLKKLVYLKNMRRERDVSPTFLVNYPLGALNVSIAYLLVARLGWLPTGVAGWEGPVMGLVGLCSVVLVLASLLAIDTKPVERWWATQRASKPDLSWLDVYASHDPVSAGRLFSTPVDGMESVGITNRASWIADHTSYWDNVDEFVTTAGTWISRVAQLSVPLHALNSKDADLARGAVTRRVWRVRGLTGSTWLTCASATLAAVGGVGTPAGRYLEAHLGALNSGWWRLSEFQLGVLAVVVVAYLPLAVTRGVWGLWDRWEAKVFCSREPDVNSTALFWMVLVLLNAGVIGMTLEALATR